MNKIIVLFMGVLGLLNSAAVFAIEKFEVLPDLPDPLAYAVQPAQAASVSGTANTTALASQSIGNEPSLVSVVLSLLFVILLIYCTGILYAKLNKLGFRTLKRQQGELTKSHVTVVSTTQLGNNKTLHVVELDGKRMLIGASSGAIQLIKDLGGVSDEDSEAEFSHIEIPNIKIPKIEIPKIEIPTIGFSKLVTKTHKAVILDEELEKVYEDDKVVATAAVEEEMSMESQNQEGIIDSLFASQPQEVVEEDSVSVHKVDPEDFALYKKYLG